MQHDPNEAKASFDDLYSQEDPRDYYSILGSLDYSIPDLAKPIFRRVASEFRKVRGTAPTILDLGSSYGINAALFRFPLTVDMLRRRYARREMMSLTSAQVREYDRHYFQSWPRSQSEKIIAADISKPAVDYACEVGLADECIAHDFENAPPPVSATQKLADVDMIISTGAVGYVTEKTFDALLKASGRTPWVISFVLRMFDYGGVAARLAEDGLVTEKLKTAAFVQRRFQDEDEAKQVLDVIANERGLDPSGLESEGLLFAELYVSRPKDEAEKAPLDNLVRVVSGRNLSFGPRLVSVKRDGQRRLSTLRP
jgi:hypothetical protein